MIARAEVGAFEGRSTIDASELDRLDDDALDELPFGVVCLDEEGTILRYNAAEARLARLDRANVVGRDFFREIAPCTATPEFKGRFDAFARGEHDGPVLRFEYLFDFKFGAQEVQVELFGADDGRYYLLINRSAFRPPREGLDPSFPAPRQRELVPDAQDVGALRDTREQRVVRAPLTLFEALLKTCDRVAPKTWEVFCREWGTQWGRRAIVELEADCLEETERSLRERPMAEVAERIAAYVREQGWGQLRIDLSSASEGGVILELERSALVAATRRGDQRRCHLLAGMLGAAFSHLAGRRLHVEEVSCAAAGHATCSMLVVGATRRDTIRGLVAEGADLAAVIEGLDGAD